MLKKTRLFVLLAVLLSVVTLSACNTGTTDTVDTTEETPVTEQVTESTTVEDAANDYFANMDEDIYKISQKDFVDKVKAGEEMTILDIRSADAYAEEHVKGAISLPWGPELGKSISSIPDDKPIMLYCVTGQTAGQTVALLSMAGFDIKSVNFGFKIGIKNVEGVEEVLTTEVTEFDPATKTKIDPDVEAAIIDYYAGLKDVAETNYKNFIISPENAKAALDAEDEKIAFLDVRKADDYAAGHIEGAMNVPFGKGMEKEFSTLPMDKTIIVYCYTGQTAGQTVAGLRMLGYDAVSLGSGTGMEATGTAGWVNEGYPLVTE